ncbi:MAG: hypothetical protein VKK59_01180 [Vampirovibrionales bacterium]|nr:hypothetical protein [Vampirovibrionales bacterium]
MALFSFRFRQKRLQAKARQRLRAKRLTHYMSPPTPDSADLSKAGAAVSTTSARHQKKQALSNQVQKRGPSKRGWPLGFRRLLSLPGLTQIALTATGVIILNLLPLDLAWVYGNNFSDWLAPSWHYFATVPWLIACALMFPPPVVFVAQSGLMILAGVGVTVLGQFSGIGFWVSPVAGYWWGAWLVSMLLPLWMHRYSGQARGSYLFFRRATAGAFLALILIHGVGSLWFISHIFLTAMLTHAPEQWLAVARASWLSASGAAFMFDAVLIAGLLPLAYGIRRSGIL